MATNLDQKNGKVVKKALLAVFGMFAFGFALVPLYDVFCEVTGINGKTGGKYEVNRLDGEADLTRKIRVQFTTQNNEQMPWQFKPVTREIRVHPGKLTEVAFYAENTTGKAMTAQAVPSLSPSQGTAYFHKTECFCFNKQTLQAGESINMPLRFVVDKALPKEVRTLTLSYTLFDITQEHPESDTGKTNNS